MFMSGVSLCSGRIRTPQEMAERNSLATGPGCCGAGRSSTFVGTPVARSASTTIPTAGTTTSGFGWWWCPPALAESLISDALIPDSFRAKRGQFSGIRSRTENRFRVLRIAVQGRAPVAHPCLAQAHAAGRSAPATDRRHPLPRQRLRRLRSGSTARPIAPASGAPAGRCARPEPRGPGADTDRAP